MSDYYPAPDELRDAWINESTSFPGEAETVEANTREGQTERYAVAYTGERAHGLKPFAVMYRQTGEYIETGVAGYESRAEAENRVKKLNFPVPVQAELMPDTFTAALASGIIIESKDEARESIVPQVRHDQRSSCKKQNRDSHGRENSLAVNVAPSAIPEDAEAELSAWWEEVERRQDEQERERFEQLPKPPEPLPFHLRPQTTKQIEDKRMPF